MCRIEVAVHRLANICMSYRPTVFSGRKLMKANTAFENVSKSMKFLSFLGPWNFIRITPIVISDKRDAEKKKYEESTCKTVSLFHLKIQWPVSCRNKNLLIPRDACDDEDRSGFDG